MPYADLSSYLKAMPDEFRAMTQKLRKIITSSDKRLQERIKWNAPSYYHIEDIVTFGPIRKEKLLLVFHHPYVVKINSNLLEGQYKDRRLVWFETLKDVKAAEKELVKIIKSIVSEIDKKHPLVKSKNKGTLKVCKHGHEFYKSSDCPVCPKCEGLKKQTGFVSGLSAPARRALENEGIRDLKRLSGYSEKKLLGLHGIGPAALPFLRLALSKQGLKFKPD
jgi:hypothetical protein